MHPSGTPLSDCLARFSEVHPRHMHWKLNTSNVKKILDFKLYFNHLQMNLAGLTDIDLKEIDSDYVQVVTHKASHLPEMTLVEDSSLFVEGIDIGPNLKWFLSRLPDLIGRKATLVALLAFQKDGYVYVFKGYVDGFIVPPKGLLISPDSPLDLYFSPYGAGGMTLAECGAQALSLQERFLPRLEALHHLKDKHLFACMPVLKEWTGKWQHQ
jgi:inosine/xanthosine triphosphate pyrophosphatase family protein